MHSVATPLNCRSASLALLLGLLFTACTAAPETSNDESSSSEESACKPKEEQECSCGKQKGTSVCSKAGEWGECKCESAGKDAGKSAALDAGKSPDKSQPAAQADAGTSTGGDKVSEPTAQGGALPCDIAALLSKHCAKCHGAETAFGAPMSLVSWDDLQQAGPKTKTKKNFELVLERAKSDASPMPPAPAARLSPDELKTLENWVKAGAPKGEAKCEESKPGASVDDGIIAKPDDCESDYELLAHSGSSATDKSKFKTSATPALEGNQYHCFYFDPPYSADAGMYWFQPVIDNKATLHHWILYATDNKTHPSGSSAGCNAAEPGAYFVAGWAPGANNASIPDDVALTLPTGPKAGLILEVHYYNNTGKAQEDASGIRFCTGAKSKRPHLAAVHTLGSEGICVQPGGETQVVGQCAPRTDMGDIHITGMWPHMHKIARRMQLSIKRKGGGTDMVHDAPFDFNSQIFHPKEDVIVKPGDSLETRCFFQNDTNMPVHYGERTQDEMCYAFVMAWPAGALAAPPGPLSNPATDLLNRCADTLSILESCNGIADRPVNVEHP